MDKYTFADGLGKKLIMRQHQSYESMKGEDLDHITNVKRIILAISEYLESEGAPKAEAEGIARNLKAHFKSLFIKDCVSFRDDEDQEAVREEAEMWFDHIWENEEYPG